MLRGKRSRPLFPTSRLGSAVTGRSSLAFSSDSKHVAIEGFGNVAIRNAESGKVLNILRWNG